MQQLSSLNTVSAFPNTMKAIEKSARDPSVKSGEFNLFGDDGFGFEDVLEAVNPLNYIPGVSTLYKEASGASVSPAISLASGALLGGPIGFLVAALSTGFELATGNSPAGTLIAMFSEDTPPATKVASLYQNAYKLT